MNLTKNTLKRRTNKPCIKIPVYQDINTNEKNIILDHFGIGMSMTSL